MDSATYPLVRRDLLYYPQNDSCTVILKDPISCRYFRIEQEEYQLLQLLDGSRSLEQACRELERQMRLDIDQGLAERFLAKLDSAKLLGEAVVFNSPPVGAGRPDRPRILRWRNRILYVRFKAVNPDRVFSRVIPHVGFLFAPLFVCAMAILMSAALALLALNTTQLHEDLAEILKMRLVAVFWLVALVTAIVHECGHGLACKYFGGEVREIGLLLIYLNPALYCNVSDAWTFTSKWRRICVLLAGPFFEMIPWALSVFVWFFFPGHLWAKTIALVIISLCGARQLFNLNPLIKLDGYYLLSDGLGIHNLRARAFAYIGAHIRKLFTGHYGEGYRKPKIRERIVFTLYCALAAPFSVAFLALAIWRLSLAIVHHLSVNLWAVVSAVGLFILFEPFFLGGMRIAMMVRKRLQPRHVAVDGVNPAGTNPQR
jgi:putative peptide zinc metalloprotease protein